MSYYKSIVFVKNSLITYSYGGKHEGSYSSFQSLSFKLGNINKSN